MTNKDKVIAAFLVSVGVFSATQAMQYVGTLSTKEKSKISMTANKSSDRIITCSGVEAFASGSEGTVRKG